MRSLSKALLALCGAWWLAGCASLPAQVQRTPSQAMSDRVETRLGNALRKPEAANEGLTGVRALDDGREAFAARMLLAQTADRSLDVQYYIWHADTTGQLLFDALWDAAERGVRVRLLLDDLNAGDLDEAIGMLDAHPNIEVRLFNPFAHRGLRLTDFATDFERVNRRMHNKSFTADNQAAIVGGRNIGDEYFSATNEVEFADMDLLLVGDVVPQVSAAFDAYWNSDSAYPVQALLRSPAEENAAALRARWNQIAEDPQAADYLDAVRDTELVDELLEQQLQLDWVRGHVLYDDPAKVVTTPERRDLVMLSHLEHALGNAQRELDIVSPYFVPGPKGTAALTALAKRGVRVRVLTNSLAATDVAAVHAGYARQRKALLEGGVQIYEWKPTPRAAKQGKRRQWSSGSAASLHAKAFAVDRQRVFVGSLNLDPRSVWLNTEMGTVVESASLADALSDAFDGRIRSQAYEVTLDPADGHLVWHERNADGQDTQYGNEPGAPLWSRLWVGLMSLLPIDWLL